MIDFICIPQTRINKMNEIPSSLTKNFHFKINENFSYHLFCDGRLCKEFTRGHDLIIFLGDFIIAEDQQDKPVFFEKDDLSFEPEMIRDFPGIFYLIQYNTREKFIRIFTSIFSLLPVYYLNNYQGIIVSSKDFYIKQLSWKSHELNKKFMVQQVLFNYGLFSESRYESIKTTQVNEYIVIRLNQIRFHIHTSIQDYFVKSPVQVKKSLEYLPDLFIRSSVKYFPADSAAIAFTSGFDSRVLISLAKQLGNPFISFAFGSRKSPDVSIPIELARKIDFKFIPIYLDQPDYFKVFIGLGKDLIRLSGGQSNYLYTHFLYSSRILSKSSTYLLTGLFGSEILRGFHRGGAVTAQSIIDLFREEEHVWVEHIRHSPVFNVLNKEMFREVIEWVIEEMLTYRKSLKNDLTLNQQLYAFIFNEAFRKLYGSIITAQMQYQLVRNPFLDFGFLKEVLATKLSGVNNVFITHNPLKRFKGQLLYPHILNKTSNRSFLTSATGKGYTPEDLLSLKGKLRITGSYLKKYFMKSFDPVDLDNLGLLSGIGYNKDHFIETIENTDLLNKDYVLKELEQISSIKNIRQRDLLILALSIADKA